MNGKERNAGGTRLRKRERRAHIRKRKIRLAVALAAVILLAFVLVISAVHQALVKAPEITPPVIDSGRTDDRVTAEDVDVPSDRKEDFYTFLVVGRDTGGGGNTDTILLAAYDIPNQKLNVMSIPRDTMVNVPWDIKKINSVYNNNGGGEEGIQALCTQVGQLVGFMPDFEVVVEWDAVGELVDVIGGVWFDVPRNMSYDDPAQNLHIHFNKGYQYLNGEDAMKVIRWRKNNGNSGYDTGDIGRIETQQAFLKVVAAQCLQIQNASKIQEFAQIFAENVQTDLTAGNLAWFAERAIFDGLTMDDVSFVILPGNYYAEAWSRTYQNKQSYVLPYTEELLAMVNESFNPYLEDRVAEQLDIMSVNEDGSVSSSTGIVKDSGAAKPQ